MDPDDVSPELRSDIHELNRRRADIAAGWAKVDAEHRRRMRVYGRAGTVSSLGLAFAVLIAPFVPIYLHAQGVLAEQTLGWLVPTSMLGTLTVGMGLWFWWYAAWGRPARSASAEFQGPLSSTDLDEARAAVDQEARRLRLARNASPRLDYLRASSRSATGWANVIIAAVIAGPALVGLGWISVDMARGASAYDGRIWLLWLVAFIAAGVVAWLRLRRSRRRQAIEEALARLATYLDGRLLASPADTVSWLNRYWAAPSGPDDYYAGPLHGGTAGRALGYPVMVDVEPDGHSGETVTYPPRVVIYLAALPAHGPAAAPSGRISQLRAAIDDAGFTVDINPDAGLVARATPRTVRNLRSNIAELVTLGPLIGNLAALAAAEGTAPAPDG